MNDRVIVQVRWRPPVDLDVQEEERDEQWLQLAPPLFDRASALGGRVVAWADRTMTVDFAWDGLYDAIDFVADAPLAPELCTGICHGPLRVIFDGPRMCLALGPALRHVALLTELSRPGEVLVSPELVELSEGRVGHIGEAGSRTGRPDIPALILDPERPLIESIRGSMLPQADLELVPLSPQKKPESQAPEALREKHVGRLALAAEVLEQEAPSMFPAALSQALRERSAESLSAIADSTRRAPSSDVSERLGAMAELASGRSGEAIRRLRAGKLKVQNDAPVARSRAALALAVALGASGRPKDAIIETLEALSRAREADDERGQRACARFLAQLSRSLSDGTSAMAWDSLCGPASSGPR